MSRFCGENEVEAVLTAALKWKEQCFLLDGALFSKESIWNLQPLAELDKHFIQKPDASNADFLTKLEGQLEKTSSETKKLASEMRWLMLLFPTNLKPHTKRSQIEAIYNLSGQNISNDNPMLSDPVLAGIGSSGTAYMTGPWRELRYLIRVITAFKKINTNEKAEITKDPWAWSKWLEDTSEGDNRSLYHMLSFLIFPDFFERIASGAQKVAIVVSVNNKPEKEVWNMSWQDIDRDIYAIRQQYQKKYNTDDLDFYYTPLRELWIKDKPDPEPEKEPVIDIAKPPIETNIPAPEYTREQAYSELFMNPKSINNAISLLSIKKNIILQGPPGVGKTFFAKRLAYAFIGKRDISKIQMIQFHQSYSYEDFIQGYRPTPDGCFELKNGIFYAFCKQAQNDAKSNYFFIIDEINRGNLSKIFGELMMLIECDKRGQEFALPLTYAKTIEDKFYIPENMHIIGTMNTADRSLAMVDYALRRRFCFIDLLPVFNEPKFKDYLGIAGADNNLVQQITAKMEELNNRIEKDKNLGKGFKIGHSYFCPPKGIKADLYWFKNIVYSEIAPLLKEYWFDNAVEAEKAIERLLS